MKLREAFNAFFLIYVWIPLIGLAIGSTILYYRVTGDLEVCKLFYPEMSRMACYFSSKTVRVPGAR